MIGRRYQSLNEEKHLEILKQAIVDLDDGHVARDAQELAYQMLLSLRSRYQDNLSDSGDSAAHDLEELASALRRKQKLENGRPVVLVLEHIEGRIDGETRMTGLFERKDDAFEYRVRLADGSIRICSPQNLECLASLYDNHCWGCNGRIDDRLERCRSCRWYICANADCKRCGCGFWRR